MFPLYISNEKRKCNVNGFMSWNNFFDKIYPFISVTPARMSSVAVLDFCIKGIILV
jgi:hypothetical protein